MPEPGYAVMFRSTSDNPKAPALKCLLNIDGTEYEVALWRATDRDTGKPRADKNGNGFFTGKVKPVEQAQSKPAPKMGDEDLFG